MPKRTSKIKHLSSYFASKWCYDWNNSRFLCAEPTRVSYLKTKEVFEIKSRIWAVNTEKAILQLTEETNYLTNQQLIDCSYPICATDTPDANCIDAKINDFYLLDIDPLKLGNIPNKILNDAIYLQVSENEEWICNNFFTDEENELNFSIPDLHPTVKKALKKACREEVKKRKAELISSINKHENYDLQLETVPPVKLVFGQEVSVSKKLIGKGLAILNGMALDYSPSAMGRAAKFHEWLKKMNEAGHQITNVKGIFNGAYAEGILVVAVSDIALSDAIKIVAQTGVRVGLFIDQNRLLSVI
ncbi:MAG: hypothetical protein RL630_1396 [Verrucomicrobiota bacterium]|jgi:hypothetical protein